ATTLHARYTPMAAWNDGTVDRPATANASTASPMPHCTTNTPAKMIRLYADNARPASACGKAMATAGCDSETKVHDTQNSAQAPRPAWWPATIMRSSTARHSGRPAAINRSAPSPLRSNHGLTMPQVQNVHSMDTLIQNRPVADSSGV